MLVEQQFTVEGCTIINFSKIENRAGNITAIQNNIDIPFAIKRVYYLYDVPGGESRGAHGHRELEQIVIAASGSFDITIDDGRSTKTITLNKPNVGLHIKSGIWRGMSNFSSGAICLVLASEKYAIEDYIRNYEEFLQFKHQI